MATARHQIKIGIIDIDMCAIINFTKENKNTDLKPNSRDDFLSQRLIDQLSEYDAFYLCTHRCGVTTFHCLSDDTLRCFALVATSTPFNPRHLFTGQIAENLQAVTKKKCLAISTPDDSLSHFELLRHERCGAGFKQYGEQYEQELLRINHKKLAANHKSGYVDVTATVRWNYTGCTELDNDSKNKQLQQIMVHAENVYPNTSLAFTFYDDNILICRRALSLLNQWLPKNSRLQIVHHDEFDGEIQVIGDVHGLSAISIASTISAMRQYSEPKNKSDKDKTDKYQDKTDIETDPGLSAAEMARSAFGCKSKK